MCAILARMQTNAPATSQHQVLSPREVRALVGGLSITTLWRMRRRGEFPEPVQLSKRRVGWRRSDVELWLLNRETKSQVH